jgi:hypothetical protein
MFKNPARVPILIQAPSPQLAELKPKKRGDAKSTRSSRVRVSPSRGNLASGISVGLGLIIGNIASQVHVQAPIQVPALNRRPRLNQSTAVDRVGVRVGGGSGLDIFTLPSTCSVPV